MTARPLPLRAWQVSAALDDRLSVLVVPAKVKRGTTLAHVQWRQNPNGLGSIGEVPFDMMESPLSVGDRLWARETWSHSADGVFEISQARMAGRGGAIYRADNDPRFPHAKWWSSAVMPREFSRLTLDVTEVRVCRLHDVTEDEARAAGAKPWTGALQSYRTDFYRLWNDQHGPGAWERNDWVAVARVAVHHRNIDIAPRGNQCVASNPGGV